MPSFYNSHCEKYARAYPALAKRLTEKPLRLKLITTAAALLTLICYIVYITLIIMLLILRCRKITAVIAVPALIFALTTAVRRKINAPRPYEKFPITPLVRKSTKGNSCPSRHTACAFAIAAAVMYVSVPAGAVMLAVAAAVAISRPVMGVHFPLDVLFGAALSLITAAAGFSFFELLY